MYRLFVSAPLSSWSLRPWILLKELAIPFETKQLRYELDAVKRHESFAQVSPTAKVPCLYHDGEVIWDSLAIMEYIAEDYPQVWAEDKKARAWSRSACAEMHSGFSALREVCGFNPLEDVPLASIPDAVQTDLRRINQLWEEGLARFGGPFLAGNRFTAVDAFFVPVASRIATYHLESMLNPLALVYQQRLLALPSFAVWTGRKKTA